MVYFDTRGVSSMKVSARGFTSGKINGQFNIITVSLNA